MDHLQNILENAFEQFHGAEGGHNADYIPFLNNIPNELCALAVVDVKGNTWQLGDDEYRFAIESISKVCTLALAMAQKGPEVVKDKIGTSPTGMPFNSVLALELHGGKPLSPLVNAGAMSTVSLLTAADREARWQTILTMQQKMGSDQIALSDELNTSEQSTNAHNKGIAWLLYSAGYLYSDPMEACDVYTRQCSTLLNVVELATMGATLANGGQNPITDEQVLNPEHTPYILAEMMMEGMYDSSGEWAYSVGLPSKSGVGGGIVSVVPGVMAIAAFSPQLDEMGNSVRGQKMIAQVANALNFNLFKA